MRLQGRFTRLREELGWAKDNFVHLKTLKEIKNLVVELIARLKHVGVPLDRGAYNQFILKYEDDYRNNSRKELLLKVLIFGAFYPNYLESQVEDPRGVERFEEDRQKAFLAYDPRRTVIVSL